MKTALVIGAGPAGLMAADRLADKGLKVTIQEANPSVGRKFLMAGKSGLNLTKDEPIEEFLSAYQPHSGVLEPVIREFSSKQVKEWAGMLGQEVFTGSSQRVFPVAMKASPLLRAWLRRLHLAGVQINTRHRWVGISDQGFCFDTPDGPVAKTADVIVLACGGASWSRLGSDGAFSSLLEKVEMVPFKPANMGFVVDWSDHMSRHFGTPIKGIALCVNDRRVRAEFILSQRGLEGGGIYAVSAAMRDGAALTIDLAPDLSVDEVHRKLSKTPVKQSLPNKLRKALGFVPAKTALLQEFGRPLPPIDKIGHLLKALPISHKGPRPLDEAISVAGGVAITALEPSLMLKAMPGVFAAGEMLDWEAPTGGYLLTGCLATGRWAGDHAADWALAQ
ncbi:MAG: TIGR03862 family flavoprotein [Pseudoruegeria sp.]